MRGCCNEYTSIGARTLTVDGLALGQHEIEAGIARGGRHSRYLLGRESNADGKHVFLRPQACNREVVVPRAVADSVTSAIECEERNQQNVGQDFRRIRL